MKTLVLTTLALLLACPSFADELMRRHYVADGLTPAALEAMLWAECPETPAATECSVGRLEEGVALTAPPALHRAVALRLAELESEAAGHFVRVDLVVVRRGADDDLVDLPASARRVVERLRGQRPGAGLVHLDSVTLPVGDRGIAHLTSDDRTFTAVLNLRPGTLGRPLVRHLQLHHRGPSDDHPLSDILSVTVPLTESETTLAGTTHYHQGGPELLVLLTPVS